MGNKIPSSWVHDIEAFEKAFRLGEVIKDEVFVNNLYSSINLLEFLAASYSFWDINESFAPVYCQNYLIVLGSLYEGIIQAAFKEKERRCLAICNVCSRGGDCPFYWAKDEKGVKVIGSELRFIDLIERASYLGMLEGLSEEDVNGIRKIRNNVHLNRLNRRFQDFDTLSTETINAYQATLKKLFFAVYKWLKNNGGICLYDENKSSLKKRNIDIDSLEDRFGM